MAMARDDGEDDGTAVAVAATTPRVLWSQRRGSVTVKFDARDARAVEVDVIDADREEKSSTVRVRYVADDVVDADRAMATGDGVETMDETGARAARAYACALELFGSVGASARAEIKRTSRAITVTFPKTTVAGHWPRLLLSKEKFRHVGTDFDLWLDEDDELAADAAFKFDLNSLEKISNYEDKGYYFPDVDDSDDDMPDMTDVYDH